MPEYISVGVQSASTPLICHIFPFMYANVSTEQSLGCVSSIAGGTPQQTLNRLGMTKPDNFDVPRKRQAIMPEASMMEERIVASWIGGKFRGSVGRHNLDLVRYGVRKQVWNAPAAEVKLELASKV